MRLWVLRLLLLCGGLGANAFGQGYIPFQNDNSSAVTNSLTNGRVVSGNSFRVALHVAPDGTTDPGAFLQSGASIGFYAPGLFNGGSYAPPLPAPSSHVMVQIKVWEAAYGSSYESAIAAPAQNGRLALRGSSDVLRVQLCQTGNPICPTLPEQGLRSILLTVPPPNSPPVISAIEDRTIDENTSTEPIPFTVGDAESPASALTVTATSSNPNLVPDANITLAGAGSDRTIRVVPRPNAYGETWITIRASDPDGGTGLELFRLIVDDIPVIVRNCDEAELRSALEVGGTIKFDCDGIIALSSPLVITQDTILDGIDHTVTLSGGGETRLLWVEMASYSAGFTLRNLTLAGGRSAEGGALYNKFGQVGIINCTFSNNLAIGNAGVAGAAGTNGANNGLNPGGDGGNGTAGGQAKGGAIYNRSSLVISNSLFIANLAQGGPGGAGGHGGRGVSHIDEFGRCREGAPGGDGGLGAAGGDAYGGAIYNEGSLGLADCTLDANRALGGQGGDGGDAGANGCGAFGAVAGPGGQGGSAHGGAVFSLGTASGCAVAFVYNDAQGGHGGNGGRSTCCSLNPLEMMPGSGGDGGDAHGGGLANSYTNYWSNVTWGHNGVRGGDGGAGGFWLDTDCRYGRFGNGGSGFGGAIEQAGYGGDFVVHHATIWSNDSFGGSATNVCAASNNGNNGIGFSPSIYVGSNTTVFLSSSIVGNPNESSNCQGNIVGHDNMFSDESCFTSYYPGQHAGIVRDPKLGPLANNGGNTLTFALLPGSAAIDAIETGENLGLDCLAFDQRGVRRQFGFGRDIGAYEWVPDAFYFRSIQGHRFEHVLRGYGIPNATFRLQASPDLTDWTVIDAGTVNNAGLFQILRDSVNNPPKRFYRIISP